MKWWGALLDHEIHWYLLNTYRLGNLCPSFCLSTTLQPVVYCTSRKQHSHSLWTLGLTDFCGSPPHQCVVNIIIILNPKHSTELATKKRINSIPDEIRTACIVATFYLSQLQLKKKNSFRFLLNFIWKTSPRKRIAPKEVPPSLCIFIAVSIQALYCKHRQERKGNKKAELAMISSTSMHWRELYRVELRQGGQTNKEAVTPQAISHRQLCTKSPQI